MHSTSASVLTIQAVAETWRRVWGDGKFFRRTYLSYVICHIRTFPHKKNTFFTLFILSRVSDKHYFSKYWGTNAWAVPPLQILGGPSPQSP